MVIGYKGRYFLWLFLSFFVFLLFCCFVESSLFFYFKEGKMNKLMKE